MKKAMSEKIDPHGIMSENEIREFQEDEFLSGLLQSMFRANTFDKGISSMVYKRIEDAFYTVCEDFGVDGSVLIEMAYKRNEDTFRAILAYRQGERE